MNNIMWAMNNEITGQPALPLESTWSTELAITEFFSKIYNDIHDKNYAELYICALYSRLGNFM